MCCHGSVMCNLCKNDMTFVFMTWIDSWWLFQQNDWSWQKSEILVPLLGEMLRDIFTLSIILNHHLHRVKQLRGRFLGVWSSCWLFVLYKYDGKHACWRQEEGHGWGVPFHEKTWTHDETDGPWAAQQALYHIIVKPSPCPTVLHLHSRKHLRTKRMRGCCPLSGEDVIIYRPE